MIDLLFGLQRRRQATLILVTHDETLAGACERIIRMADGRVEAAKRSRRRMTATERAHSRRRATRSGLPLMLALP